MFSECQGFSEVSFWKVLHNSGIRHSNMFEQLQFKTFVSNGEKDIDNYVHRLLSLRTSFIFIC